MKKYFYLFAAGMVLIFLHKLELDKCDQYVKRYVFLGESLYYSFLYYSINFILGNTYLYLFRQNYMKANRERIPSGIATITS